MSAACTFIPLPTPPFIIRMGQIFHPGIVALVGALGNCTAGFIEYHFLTWFFTKIELRRKIDNNWYFQKFANFIKRSAFLCIVITGFIPLYMEPFRIAAILTRFVLHKYLLAIFTGKLLRIYLIAMIGNTFHILTWLFFVLLIVLFFLPGIWVLLLRILQKNELQAKKIIIIQ